MNVGVCVATFCEKIPTRNTVNNFIKHIILFISIIVPCVLLLVDYYYFFKVSLSLSMKILLNTQQQHQEHRNFH